MAVRSIQFQPQAAGHRPCVVSRLRGRQGFMNIRVWLLLFVVFVIIWRISSGTSSHILKQDITVGCSLHDLLFDGTIQLTKSASAPSLSSSSWIGAAVECLKISATLWRLIGPGCQSTGNISGAIVRKHFPRSSKDNFQLCHIDLSFTWCFPGCDCCCAFSASI